MDAVENKLQKKARPTDTMEFSVQELQKHDQLRKLSSANGQTYFDAENNKIVVGDGVSNANITLDGGSSKLIFTDPWNLFAGSISATTVMDWAAMIFTCDYLFLSECRKLDVWDNSSPRSVSLYGDGEIYCADITVYDNEATFYGGARVIGGLNVENGLNVLSGTKNFRIQHPLKEDNDLVYTCPEMPEVLLMCRGNGEVILPDHFVAVTEEGTLQVIKDHENGNWLATAIRKGYKDFNPEQERNN